MISIDRVVQHVRAIERATDASMHVLITPMKDANDDYMLATDSVIPCLQTRCRDLRTELSLRRRPIS